MKELLLQILIIAYACVSIITIIAYWPTIKDLYYRKKASSNITTYILWVISSGVAFLYGLFILSDLLFRIVAGFSFALNILVLVLSINLKYSKRKTKLLKKSKKRIKK